MPHPPALAALLRRVAAVGDELRVVVRGGVLMPTWTGDERRSTSDLDLLALDGFDEAHARTTIARLLATEAHDGWSFIVEKDAVIYVESDAPGLKSIVRGTDADGGDEVIEIDLGYGDSLPLPPEMVRIALNDSEVVGVTVTPVEVGFAWKLHGLFEKPCGRWRPKDLLDLFLLVTRAELDRDKLLTAVELAFSERHLPVGAARQLVDGDLGRKSSDQWDRFRAGNPDWNPPALDDVLPTVRGAVEPILDALQPRGRLSVPPSDETHPFPTHVTYADVLTAIEGRPEFLVYRGNGLRVVNIECHRSDSLPDPETASDGVTRRAWQLRRECRGLTFDDSGHLVARKYHQFFEVNEQTADVWRSRFESERPWVLEKLDGSLITGLLVDSEVRWSTRRGRSSVGRQATEWITAHAPHLNDFAREWCSEGWTPLFEWCSRQQRIVIDHPRERLVLHGLRNIATGDYMPFDELRRIATDHQTEIVAGERAVESFDELIRSVREQTYREGVVLRWDDGTMLKVKSDWYRLLHDAVEKFESERAILRLLLNGDADTLHRVLPPAHRRRFGEHAARFRTALARRIEWAEENATSAILSRLANVTRSERRVLLRVLEGVSADDAVRAVIAEDLHVRSGRGVRRVRTFLALSPWCREDN